MTKQNSDKKESTPSQSELKDLLCVKRPLITIAARLVLGNCLNELYEICENQKHITTNRLERIVDKVAENLKQEAVYIRNQANKIKA